jgi:SlyX protein
MSEDRFIEIEIKLSRQEDLVESLNEMVYRQQRKLDELEALCAALARHVQNATQASGEPRPGHEKPPHY